MNRLLDLYDHGILQRPRAFPALNVWEDGTNLYAEAEVPGLNIEDMEILVEGDALTIKGERKQCEQSDCSFHRRERGAGEFVRTLTLPVQVNADGVSAALKNGVLLVTLPKAETAKTRKIQVKAD